MVGSRCHEEGGKGNEASVSGRLGAGCRDKWYADEGVSQVEWSGVEWRDGDVREDWVWHA